MMTVSAKTAIFCDTLGCILPIAYLKDGVLIIESRHRGKKHTATIRIEALYQKETPSTQQMTLVVSSRGT